MLQLHAIYNCFRKYPYLMLSNLLVLALKRVYENSTPCAYLVPFVARENVGNCGTKVTDDCLPNPNSPQEQPVFFTTVL